jgi:SAM-dependent methyltransferase
MEAKILHTKDTYPRSVEAVVPLIVEMLHPQSVVDFGCGIGCWLEAFHRRGVTDILGIDGAYITEADLLIPYESFFPFDLERVWELDLHRRFDVALCLECAEHLDASAADKLVNELCRSATHIVFAAAVPGQTGMGHKNEQYPEYWRALFARSGYRMFDYFRPILWNNGDVEFWYRQNTYLFSRTPEIFRCPTNEWDGKVYIARELLDMYVRAFDTVNTERLAVTGSTTRRDPPSIGRRALGTLRQLGSRVRLMTK